MVSHQSDATIGAGNSSYLVSFPAKFIKGLPQCALDPNNIAELFVTSHFPQITSCVVATSQP